MRRIALAAAVAGVSCTIDVSLEDKRCPCGDGWICDALTDTCVQPTCEPTVTIGGLEGRWSTSHQILWAWEVQGEPESFVSYELVLAESEEDLATGTGTARVFDATTNPELAGPVAEVLTRGLDPETTYYAHLVVTDASQCTRGSDVVARATHPQPLGSIDVFVDALPTPGALQPADRGGPAIVSDEGGAHIQYVPRFHDPCVPENQDFEDVRAVCGQPIKLQDLVLDVSRDENNPQLDRISQDTFGNAFVEMRVSSEAPIDTLVYSIWVAVGACPPETCHYEVGGFTVPSTASYETLQIPLSEFRNEAGEALTYELLDVPTGEPIIELAFSFRWHKTGTYRFDDIAFRF